MSQAVKRMDSWTLTGRLTLGTVATLALLFWWVTWSFEKSQQLSGKSPTYIFRMLFHEPVPIGVTSLKYAGDQWNEVYLRATVNDPASFIKMLQSNKSLQLEVDPDEQIRSFPGDRYAEQVGWQDVMAVKHPVVYGYHSVPTYPGWEGLIVIDKASGVLYVQGSNM